MAVALICGSHAIGDHGAGQKFGGFAEAVLHQFGDGGDIILAANVRNMPRTEGKNIHANHIGQGDGNGHHAAAIGIAPPADQGAAANDGGADGGHEHHRPQSPTGNEEIPGGFDLFCKIKADP